MKFKDNYLLEQAVAEGSIYPVFQPVVDIKTRQIIGAEVLARWTQADGTSVPPDIFISQSMESGLIVPLSLSIINSVRTLLIHNRIPSGNCLTIGFNTERACLESTIFIKTCLEFIASFSEKGISLALEITEREPISNMSLKGLELLRQAGAIIVLDDFGTGYATLEAIQVIKPDIVKLDRTLTTLADQGDKNNILSHYIDEMNSRSGLRILAEGVETFTEQTWLYSHGVSLMQGWRYGRPQKWNLILPELMADVKI